jgi:hypothetical protein
MPAAKGLPAMTLIETIEDHQSRCQPHLLRLQMIAHGNADVILTRQSVVEIAQATRAILTEAETAARGAWGVSRGGPGAAALLQARLNRLAVTVEDAIAAAGSGDFGQLRRHLDRFVALTAAIWTVQQAIYGARRIRSAPGECPGSVRSI